MARRDDFLSVDELISTYRGPTPWKDWKKGDPWSLKPTKAEVAYFREFLAAPGDPAHAPWLDEAAVEAATLQRIEMDPRKKKDAPMATTKKATEKRSGTKAKRQRSLRYTGPTPWKTWKKGQRWSLEPTAAEVAYYRKTIAEANPDISRDEIEEGAIEAAQMARIDMAPKGAGGYEDWKKTGRFLTKMRDLYKKRMGAQRRRLGVRKKSSGGSKSKRKVGGGVKRSSAKAVQPKKLRLPKRLAGKSFCLTGTMSAPRDDVHAAIVRAGGTVHSSLKASTDYLVKGAKPGGTKLAKAKQFGTTVITEKKLWSLTSS